VRLCRLDLVRYGHFTDRSFPLPAGKPDFHIVFGPNEAGKSTALSAIEDLLFGIPMLSQYGFLHDYNAMRVGAVLENGSSSLEVLRRKGNKDTLLGKDGFPDSAADGVLKSLLAGADRPFFERMFSLDHTRLEAGGREILNAKDDVGQMLFSAGAGIARLRERLSDLSDEADDLWGARRAKHRKFYVADDKLKDADKKLRDEIFPTGKWQELKRDFEAAEEAYAEVDAAFEKISVERNRLSRIRRVYRDVRRKREIDGLLEALGEVITLPEDAARLLESAERKDTEAATRISTLDGQLERTRIELAGLTFDAALVQRADDVRHLHERRIEIRGEKADLPKREAELHAAEEELRQLASEVGWTEADTASLIKRIPSRTKIGVVRSLLNQRGELDADAAGKSAALRDGEEEHDSLKKSLAETTDPIDVSKLGVVTRAVREQGDIAGRIRAAERRFKDAQGRVKRRLAELHPGVSSEQEVRRMPVPARVQVQDHRALVQDWNQRLRETRQRAASIRQELESAIDTFERSKRDGHIVSAEDMAQARSRRDGLWKLVKLKHVQGAPIPETVQADFKEELDDLAAAFEPSMSNADALADRRFDHAEAVGKLAEINRKIGDQKTVLKQIRQSEEELAEEGKRLDVSWSALWREAPFEPLAPDVMLEWFEARKAVLEAFDEQEAAESGLGAARAEEHDARRRLLTELAALGVDRAGAEADALPVVLESAAEELRVRQNEAVSKAQLKEAVRKAASNAKKREQDLVRATTALEAWQQKWGASLGDLGLADDTAPEAVSAQIDVIDQMRVHAGKINALRHDRIGKINRDIALFDEVVRELIEPVAADLRGRPAEDAVLEVEKRLAEAERVKSIGIRKNEEVQELTAQIAALEEARGQSRISVAHLMQVASVETSTALKEVIKRSDQHRSFEDERRKIIAKLQQEGDGLSIDELESECDGVDIDEVAARERSIQEQLEDLKNPLAAAAEERAKAREAFHAVGGNDLAARAAAERQEAIAEMREVTERYVRIKTSAMLLNWAIDRYRREKQAPLLKRAGGLFAIMTGGSFTSLQVEFKEQDQAHLTGARPDGKLIAVSGMSSGTADQLYLALRVASIEDYLERAGALPFVADDLFINFDDERAAAGFKILAQLAEKTQVLFFTHHRHLVDIAKYTLGSSAHVINLA
jgi:uncharacterized protein YhaN